MNAPLYIETYKTTAFFPVIQTSAASTRIYSFLFRKASFETFFSNNSEHHLTSDGWGFILKICFLIHTPADCCCLLPIKGCGITRPRQAGGFVQSQVQRFSQFKDHNVVAMCDHWTWESRFYPLRVFVYGFDAYVLRRKSFFPILRHIMFSNSGYHLSFRYFWVITFLTYLITRTCNPVVRTVSSRYDKLWGNQSSSTIAIINKDARLVYSDRSFKYPHKPRIFVNLHNEVQKHLSY